MHVAGGKEIDHAAVLHLRRQAHVGVFAAAGHALDRLRLEGDFHPVQAEQFLDDDAGEDFVVRRLEARIELPVHLQLLVDVGHVACLVDLALDTATFLMSHFRFQAVKLQGFDGLFQRRADIASCALPVLFLHHLGRGQGFNGGFSRGDLTQNSSSVAVVKSK